jgi:hypothetical protein
MGGLDNLLFYGLQVEAPIVCGISELGDDSNN